MQREILIVDDDRDLGAITAEFLEAHGYRAILAGNGEEAYDLLRDEVFDLILLDINLPDANGFAICEELRELSKVPIIFASARTSEDDRVTGFDIGGDDYLPKPYSLRELLSRVKALLRRTYPEGEGKILRSGRLRLDVAKREFLRDGEPVHLSGKEFDLLRCLMEHPNETMSKDELLSQVWGVYSEAEPSTVSVHIRWLREKLEQDPSKPVLIQTVWGKGYRFCHED